MYVLTEGTTLIKYPCTAQELKALHPNVSFPARPSEVVLASFGLQRVQPMPLPSYDATTHKVVEGSPVLTEGAWVQQWSVVALTEAELAARIPTSVSPRQARLALLGAGLLPLVQTALEALPEPMKSAALIEWEYATTIDRGSNLVTALGGSLGLTEAQLDGLFIAAATL